MPYNAEIQAWFTIRSVPKGSAPQSIREQWVDVPVPLRYTPIEAPAASIGHGVLSLADVIIIDDAISVESLDAIKALRLFGKQDAAEYWDDTLRSFGYPGIAFRGNEGQIMPPGYIAGLLPGIEEFDALD
jgi:hypothetical protein